MNKFITKYSRNIFNTNKSYFSTLIVPQINSQIIHQNIHNLSTAASQLDKDIHVILYSTEKLSEEIIKKAQSVKNVTKVFTYSNSNYNLNDISGEHLSTIIVTLNTKINSYDNIISPSNCFGKNFMPRIAGSLDVQPLSEVSKIESNQGKTLFSRYFYAGNAISTFESVQKPNVMTIRLTSFDKSEENTAGNCEVVDLSGNKDIEEALSKTRSSKFVENLTTKTDKVELSQAKVVVSGGRALKSKENFQIIEKFASCFDNCAIGASRAAVDAGYVPNDLQVGQTGKVVAPDLYFAIGISGAIQHVAGMKDSKVIVAINSDADCPIFNIATYGLVGDLFTIIPELTSKINTIKNKH